MDEHRLLPEAEFQGLVRPGLPAVIEQRAEDVTPGDAPDLLKYGRIVLKRFWVVITCLLVVFATVGFGTLKQKPVYQSTVLIEIDPEPPNVLNFKEILQIDSTNIDNYLETQYKILKSWALAERAVSELRLDRNPEFYRKRSLFGLIERDPEKLSSSPASELPDTKSVAFENSVNHFLDVLDVGPVRRSNLVEVSFLSNDPQLAAKALNQLAADYIDQNLRVKWDATTRASEWLQDQLVEIKAKLEKSENALQVYAKENSILFVEEKQNLANARLKQLQEEYTKAQAERFQKESFYNLVQSDKVQELPGFSSNRLVQDLSTRLVELRRQYAELRTTFKPNYPASVELERQIETVQAALDHEKQTLAQNVVEEYRSANSEERLLAQALEQQKKEVNDIAEKSINYNILKREADTNRQLYDGLLQRLKEAQVSAGLKASNIRIVDPGRVPRRAVRPRVVFNLALGFVVGLVLGVGMAFFMERLDNTLKSPDDVESLLRLPMLGVVPTGALVAANGGPKRKSLLAVTGGDAKAPGIVLHAGHASVEAFRSLATSLLLLAKPKPKVVLITSAVPREGKTTITINLAKTLASLGNRVAIIDGDLRRPSCHLELGLRNEVGFVSYVTTDTDALNTVFPVPGMAGLHLVPTGPVPPNPVEVLSSPGMGELINKLRDEFDYLLIDSPPLLAFADSRILSTFADGAVLVVRGFTTPYDLARRARELLRGTGVRMLGVVLNDVDVRRDGYGDKYGYYYGYGYGSEKTEGQGSLDSNLEHKE